MPWPKKTGATHYHGQLEQQSSNENGWLYKEGPNQSRINGDMDEKAKRL